MFLFITHTLFCLSNYQKIAVQKMTSAKETQCQTILHLWNQGITNGQEIHRRTSIPLATIYKNIKKLKKREMWLMQKEMVS